MNRILIASLVALLLSGCLGGEEESNNSSPPPSGEDTPSTTDNRSDTDAGVITSGTDVANLSQGATAVSSFNSSTASNLIDGSEMRAWISAPDIPINITLSKQYQIAKIEIAKDHEAGTDVTLEISDDGVNYKTLSVTNSPADVTCSDSAFYSIRIKCLFEPAQTISHIRLTSLNGRSYRSQELSAYTD